VALVYISSTFSDLQEHREQVYRALRRMRHDVIAMEDYVSRDDRPLAKCLEDVEKCDVYIGIFAWRYGHIPAEDNPGHKSITELELRHALLQGKPCLIFLTHEDTPWPPSKSDRGEAQAPIVSLRDELAGKKMVSFFDSADDLAAKVSAAVHVWEIEHLGNLQQSAPSAPVTPQHREVSHSALLAYIGADEPFAQKLARQLESYGRNLLLYPPALFASRPEDFQELETQVRKCHTAIVLLSDAALVQMQQEAGRSRKILRMLLSRTGHLIFLCPTGSSLAQAAAWEPSSVIDAGGWGGEAGGTQIAEVDQAIEAGTRQGRPGVVGLPFLVAAMTDSEALQLEEEPDLLTQKLGEDTCERFLQLVESLKAYGAVPWHERYGPRREDWRPFLSNARTAVTLIEDVVDRLNQLELAPLRGRAIKIQQYPFDPLIGRDPLLWGVYREISKTGCVVLVDELSLFHPKVREALFESPLVSSDLATLVTIAPFDPYGVPLNEILETELRRRLAVAFDRYTFNFDPLCELGIGSEQRLRRWFHGSLPEALRNLRSPGPDRPKVEAFARKVISKDSVGATDLVYSPGKTF
jgi:hypothetical protein